MRQKALCNNSPWMNMWIWMLDVKEFVNRPKFI